MVPCAYLRVFEPLDAFPPGDRERWGRYVAAGNGLSAGAALRAERDQALSRLVGRAPATEEAALVRRVGDRIHLCPLQVPERQAMALLAFQESLPLPAFPAFVTSDEPQTALSTIQRLQRPPHIQAYGWEVPLRWFVAFDPAERHFVDPPEGDGPRLTYLSTVAAGLERLDRVIAIIERSVEDGEQLVDGLNDLVDWLANFDDGSLLELDYGGLTEIIPRPDLAIDTSCEELWRVVDALDRGDGGLAASTFEAVQGRWQHHRHHVRSN